MSADNLASNKIINSNTRCTLTKIHTHKHTHAQTHSQTNTHKHTHKETHSHKQTHTNTHTLTQTHAQTYRDPPVVVYIHRHTQTQIHRHTQTSPVVVYVVTDTVKPVQKKSIAKLAIVSGVPSKKSCCAMNGVKPWAMQLCWFFRMLPLESVARTDVDRIEVSLYFLIMVKSVRTNKIGF